MKLNKSKLEFGVKLKSAICGLKLLGQNVPKSRTKEDLQQKNKSI